ncbi:MAG: hypothetical protein A2Z14_19245 [Chloroflexi bacterium RBG_16_48_8]|nr:MAG: hypothetical protein A2Z14_19245 [Chloroflexi bacterium RBG_16_48_8]
MIDRLIQNLTLGIIVLSLTAGCNFQSFQEESPPHSPATVAAQTLEAVFTKVASHSERFGDGAEISTISPVEDMSSPSTSTGTCINRALFVDDITIRDNMQIEARSSFIKIWRLRNDGTCIWDRSYSLTFIGGERMEAPTIISLMDTIQPGQTLDLSIEMTAPEGPGTYQGFWRLKSDDGDYFGIGSKGDQSFWVKITVVASPHTSPTFDLTPTLIPSEMPQPAESPTPTASPQPTPTVHHQGEIHLILGQDINLDDGEISSVEGKDLTLLELTTSEYSLTPNHSALLGDWPEVI